MQFNASVCSSIYVIFIRKMLRILLAIGFCTAALTTAAANPSSQTFEKALDLVHAYSGSGDELQRAMKFADELSKSAPKSGYAQILRAEALSTWRLDQDGSPTEVRNQVITLTDEAISLNSHLAQAYVPKARALVRSSLYGPANSSIDAALSIDQNLSSAIFLRADVFRRTRALNDADIWYRKFIAATPSPARKSNGYGWLARMYQDEAWYDAKNRLDFVAKARAAYEASLELAPDGAWRNVNFAIFLNDYAADFDTAERYAQKALGLMEFSMARYHLAAARYQRLNASSLNMSPEVLTAAAANIAESTAITLQQALAFSSFSPVVLSRLTQLQAQLSAK